MSLTIVEHYLGAIERTVTEDLKVPGLMPFWTSADARAQVPADALAKIEPLLADPQALATTPASSWAVELLYAWRIGLVYFRDAATKIADDVAITAKRVLLRDTRIDRFCTIIGDLVLIKSTFAGSHTVIEGPAVLLACRLRHHLSLGPIVIIENSGFEPFSKVVRFVHIKKSLIASHCAIEGGTHPEQIPLGAQRRLLGCTIGPDAWVGQHVSVTGGGIVGQGTVVATHTAISKRYSDFVFVSGTPPREYPIDFNIRGLTEAEAVDEGGKQGILALNLPIYGPHRVAVTPDGLELDYAEHGCLRGLASINLLHFQRGVLLTSLTAMFPKHDIKVESLIGSTIRFRIAVSPPIPDAFIPPARVTPASFRGDVDAGMLAEKAGSGLLAVTWNWLATSTEPPPPFKPAVPAIAVTDVLPDTQVSAEMLATLTGLVARLTSQKAPIDPDAPFHTIGLDSIAAAELSVSVELQFNVSAPDVFRNNTVRKLARAIARGQRS